MSIDIIDISHDTIGNSLLLYPFLRQLRVSEIINRHCPTEAEIPVGEMAQIIILSRFSDKRVPMYKLQDFCSKNGIGTLLSVDTSKINDDRSGRALDSMSESLSDIKAALIVGVIKEFDIKMTEIHTDITNILFSGSYEELESGQLQVTYGHTKKGQDPRKKQVTFSLSVTADGRVPVWYEALNGNTTDSVCYVPHLDALDDELGVTSPLIVGDSKLVSNNNMIAFCRAGAFFIGPASLNKDQKERLVKLWENGAVFVPLSFKQRPDEPEVEAGERASPFTTPSLLPFWGMETDAKLTDKQEKRLYPIRRLYIFSRNRRKVIQHTREKNFKKATQALEKIIRCLNKYDYTTEAVIYSRIKNYVISKYPYYNVKLTKNEQGLFSIEYSIDCEQLSYDEMFDGIYVLICNVDKQQYPMSRVLGCFKEQCMVERSFENIKNPPICVEPVWLHKPQRIESLLFCIFVALLSLALLEREARKKVAPKQIPLRVEGRDNLPLTAAVLMEAFDGIAIYTITLKANGKMITIRKCDDLSMAQRYVLWALDLPPPSELI